MPVAPASRRGIERCRSRWIVQRPAAEKVAGCEGPEVLELRLAVGMEWTAEPDLVPGSKQEPSRRLAQNS